MSFRPDKDTYDKIGKLALDNHTSKSEMLRRLVDLALDKELAKGSIDFIREQIHDEIKSICMPQFERLAKLSAKIGYQTIPNFYLLIHIMSQLLHPDKREVFDDMVQRSKMMSIAYLKLSEKEFAEFNQNIDKAIELLDFK
ncbi:MAG: hypothetical protein K0R90_1333 [Oscillospiraceae bacterium]|jgi:hypothetical protein|nr:hypothetical protein [Oscillospiraceae bacterium]